MVLMCELFNHAIHFEKFVQSYVFNRNILIWIIIRGNIVFTLFFLIFFISKKLIIFYFLTKY